MVEELEKTESTWKMHPSAARNKQLLKKWKSQLKVINDSNILIFPIDFCIPIIFFNFSLNCSNVLDLRNLQEQVKKAFVLTFHCLKKLF